MRCPRAATCGARQRTTSPHRAGGGRGAAATARRQDRSVNRALVPALGVVLVLVGLVWTLQGAGILPGSFMTGDRLWLVIGLVCLVAGVALLLRAVRARTRR